MMEMLYDTIIFILNWISERQIQRERERYAEELRRAIREWEGSIRHAERNMMREYAEHSKAEYDKLVEEYNRMFA